MSHFSYRTKNGWFPHPLGGWMQLCCATQVWETREEAELNCPDHCYVVNLWKNYDEVHFGEDGKLKKVRRGNNFENY